MNNSKIINKKNIIVLLTLAGSIFARLLLNIVFGCSLKTNLFLIIPSVILLTLNAFLILKKINPKITMYSIMITLMIESLAMLIGDKTLANYCIIFYCLYVAILYADKIVIGFLGLANIIVGAVFYILYGNEIVSNSNLIETLPFIVAYLTFGTGILLIANKINSDVYKKLEEVNKENEKNQEQKNILLANIKEGTTCLGESNVIINNNISSTRENSSQMLKASEEIGKKATEEVSIIEKIRRTVSENVDEISNIKDDTNKIKDIIQDNTNEVKNGLDNINILGNSVDKITNNVSDVNTAVNNLMEKSQNIFSILDMLKGITEQTNLLALNASIEAAHAGDMGKGFAVVANEVKKLAANSAESADEISKEINDFLNIIQEVKFVLDKQNAEIDNCSKQTENIIKLFNTINDNSNTILDKAKVSVDKANNLNNSFSDTSDQINSISDSVENTAAAIEEIVASIDNIHNNIDYISEEYENINAISGQLSDLTNNI